MRNRLAALLLLAAGAALLTAALSLYGSNRREDDRAGQESASRLSELLLQIETRPETEPTGTMPLSPEDCVMKEVDIDGNAYIGYLSIPDLELELPVMSQWTYDALQTAPCRYTGTMKGGNLVLLAHNYDQHFGRLDELPEGAELDFTDMEGTTYHYRTVLREILDGGDVEGMTAGDHALSLFTCTYDSQSRIVVRCERIEK